MAIALNIVVVLAMPTWQDKQTSKCVAQQMAIKVVTR